MRRMEDEGQGHCPEGINVALNLEGKSENKEDPALNVDDMRNLKERGRHILGLKYEKKGRVFIN